MVGSYELKFGTQTVGRAQVERQGLYYLFQCRCRMAGAVVCRVVVQCADRTEDLGILVPVDGEFRLDKRVPVKRFHDAMPKFRVIPSRPREGTRFVPIKPEEPFAYIERLKEAYLVRQRDNWGILVKENAGT